MEHESVLLREAIDLVFQNPDGIYLDCTGGLGGHSAELLSRLSQKAQLWICDYHLPSVERLQKRFAANPQVKVIYSRFSQIFDNLDFSFNPELSRGVNPELNRRAIPKWFDGILADFGISSPQLTDPQLGIGFSLDGVPLDMRIDKNLTETAADLLNESTEPELADIFFYYGGERQSRKIARAIVTDRDQKPFATTDDLRELCTRVLGKFYFKKKIHPATKIFQALRIAVNHELDEIKTFLETAPLHLKESARLVVISFHEGEDRLVKEKFRELEKTESYSLPMRKSIKPSDEEIKRNPRARSALMRVLEKD